MRVHAWHQFGSDGGEDEDHIVRSMALSDCAPIVRYVLHKQDQSTMSINNLPVVVIVDQDALFGTDVGDRDTQQPNTNNAIAGIVHRNTTT